MTTRTDVDHMEQGQGICADQGTGMRAVWPVRAGGDGQ